MSLISACFKAARSSFYLPGVGSVRTATKRAGGTVHNHGGSPGKRLGIKKFSDQSVIPGNIIVRQRGTQFHPGPHVKMGRDHTIYAIAPGVVRFYKTKWLRGERKYVGVVLERGERLPRDERGEIITTNTDDSLTRTFSNVFVTFKPYPVKLRIATYLYQMAFQLTIAAPLKPADIPPEESILATAYAVLESTSTWKEGKTYCKNTVKTFARPKGSEDGASWCCRVSRHNSEEATFDMMWNKLGKDKAINEKEFIPDIHKVTQVKNISPTQSIWTLQYKFPPPLSPRVFTVLQVRHLSESFPRTGIVVSIPVDLTDNEDLAKLEEKGVKGRYASVERIIELPDGGLEWRMATSANPGGRIPTFISESSMAGKISEDVPHFMNWLRRLGPDSNTN